MKKTIILITLLAILGIAAKQYLFTEEEKVAQAGDERSPVVESTRKATVEPVQRSRREILSGLPEKPPIYGALRATREQSEAMDVFRELGAVDGEAALDHLMDFYGKGNQGLAYAMGYALTGWMEKDFDSAKEALFQFLDNPNYTIGFSNPNSPYLFKWKGEKFHSGMM